MHITDLPNEILHEILRLATKENQRNGVQFTFGLCQPPGPPGAPYARRPSRYVRGAVPPPLIKMDATQSIRSVCKDWHEWGLQYALKDLYVRCWRGSERWCDLPLQRTRYALYELIDRPKGEKVYRDPYATLRETHKLVTMNPHAARSIRRMWFDGLYAPETDVLILSTIQNCGNLQSVSIPWTVLRHGSAKDWAQLLATNSRQPLKSLEILSTTLSSKQLEMASQVKDLNPLQSAKVNFSQLRRLKLFGDSTFMPVTDDDLIAMARTAVNLEEFQVTSMSTITIKGVMAIVEASQQTLRVLEHSPRSMAGFYHPHPGSSENKHLCTLLTECPKLEDLSVSLPSMCPSLFANQNVKWRGDCQVRALYLCGHEPQFTHDSRRHSSNSRAKSTASSISSLRRTLSQARSLTAHKAESIIPVDLALEIFFADCIFEPHVDAVHGEFVFAELSSHGAWPLEKFPSRKGAYGSTGLYGKDDEETVFEMVPEREFLRGLEAGYICV